MEFRATEWGRESNLGVVTGERVGGVGERVQSVRWAGVFLECCEGGMIWAGRWSGAGDFILFFPWIVAGGVEFCLVMIS